FPRPPIPCSTPASLRFAPDRLVIGSILLPFRSLSATIRKPASLRLIVDLSSVRHHGDIHSRRAGGLWKTACVLLEPKGEPAGTNFASLTRDVFRRASTGGMPGFPDEFSDVVRSQVRTLL